MNALVSKIAGMSLFNKLSKEAVKMVCFGLAVLGLVMFMANMSQTTPGTALAGLLVSVYLLLVGLALNGTQPLAAHKPALATTGVVVMAFQVLVLLGMLVNLMQLMAIDLRYSGQGIVITLVTIAIGLAYMAVVGCTIAALADPAAASDEMADETLDN